MHDEEVAAQQVRDEVYAMKNPHPDGLAPGPWSEQPLPLPELDLREVEIPRLSPEELAAITAPMDPLIIENEAGAVIFALHADGTATMPDPEQAPLAAAIFWREVLAMADRLGIQVVTS